MVTGSIGTVSCVSEPNNLLSSGPDGLDYAVIVVDELKVAQPRPSAVVAGQTLVGNAWGLQMSTPIYSILNDMAVRGGPGTGFEITT